MAKIAEVQEVARSLLVPYARNAKIHSEEQVQKIADSINEFGFVSPCLIDRDYNIIAGHGRVMAAELLGMETVPCVFIEGLTDEQRRAYIIADNRLTELGEWDMDLVNDELIQLDELDFDISVTGFDLDFSEDPKAIIEDDIPEEAEPRCKVGDIWQLGDHRLMCGDSTDPDCVDKLMDGAKADITITSPPYGAANVAKIRDHYVKGADTRKSFYMEHDDNPSTWRDLIEAAFSNMQRASSSQFMNVQMLADNKAELVGFVAKHASNLCDVIVWDKGKAPPQMQSCVLNNQYEFIFVFDNVNGSRTIPFSDFHGNVSNIIKCGIGINEYADVHRAVYPVELVGEILNVASVADTVFDCFGGTGTTLIACEQLNRKCYMMELDPHYCDVIIERWEQFTGEKAVKL